MLRSHRIVSSERLIERIEINCGIRELFKLMASNERGATKCRCGQRDPAFSQSACTAACKPRCGARSGSLHVVAAIKCLKA